MEQHDATSVSWPIMAGVIVIVLFTVLGAGVVFARLGRPAGTSAAAAPITSSATATTAATAATTPTAIPQARVPTFGVQPAVATPKPIPRPASGAPVAAATAQSGVINVAFVDGTPQLLPLGAATPTPTEWWAQMGPVTPNVGDELSTAYSRFWNVRAQVQLSLDPGPLSQVEDGLELKNDTSVLRDLRAQNHPQQINVQHHVQILHATADDAAIRDDYVSYTVPVDPANQQPLTPSPTGTSHLIYHFRKLSGTWKVVDAVKVNE